MNLKNKIKKALWLIIPVVVSCGAAKDGNNADGAEDKKSKEKVTYEYGDDKTLLWEITGKGLKTPSYLYGTIHIQNARVFAYDTVVSKIFAYCDAYAMELNIEDMDLVKMKDFLTMDLPIDSFVTPAQFKSIDSLLQKRMNVKLTSMQQRYSKPFFIYSELMVSSEKKDKALALDLDFFYKAKSAGKKLIGIEKFEEQFAAVDMISIEDQVKMLLEMLKEKESDSLYNLMVDTYIQGDLEKMLVITTDTTMPDNFEKAFLTDRNIRMAERIAKISAEQPTFNAVGAGHLGGPEGVIALLRKNGYTVKPIKTKFKEVKK